MVDQVLTTAAADLDAARIRLEIAERMIATGQADRPGMVGNVVDMTA